jgi:hypothetical protein
MPLANLTDSEKAVIHACLECVVSGEIILHNWEFHPIMGISVEELQTVLDAWPDVNDSEDVVYLAINNSMNNLLRFPHGHHERWLEFLVFTRQEVDRVFAKWREGFEFAD